MTDSRYQVTLKDGTILENLTYSETLVHMLPGGYDYVRPMNYGEGLGPANEERRKAWMKK